MRVVSSLSDFRRKIWNDLLDLWKLQLWVGFVLALLTFGTQWRLHQFTGSITDNLTVIVAPYVVLIAAAVLFNVTRTIYLGEASAIRSKRAEERREERRERMAKVPVPAPNLKFRKVRSAAVFVGPEIGGRSYDSIVAEVGNELSNERIVGSANKIRAHLLFFGKNNEVIDTLCPAYWADQSTEVWIRVGEGGSVVLASFANGWCSGLHGHVELKVCKKIHLQLIDTNGGRLLEEGPIVFEYRHDEHGNGPSCKRI